MNLSNKRVLILGGTGMLGHKLCHVFAPLFDTYVTLRAKIPAQRSIFGKAQVVAGVDVLQMDSLVRAMAEVKPDVVVNCIGIVKQAPEAEDSITALTINSLFPHRAAALSRANGARFIHVSTDCVFSGNSGMYREADMPDPVDLYGRTKLLGEVSSEGCLTVRTSIIGRELATRWGLVEWLLSSRGQTVKGFTNATYSGFPTLALGRILADIILNRPTLSGLYHVSSDPISKHDLLCLLRDAFGISVEIEPFADCRCDRSLDSARFRAETGFAPQSWPEMIREMAQDPFPYEEWRANRGA